MRVVRWQQPAQFLQHVTPYLLQQEAKNNILFGITGNLTRQPTVPPDTYMAHVEDVDGGIMLAAVRTPPHRLLISVVARQEALPALLDDVYATYGTISGVNAAKADAAWFAEHWAVRTGQTYRLNIPMRCYQLTAVHLVRGVVGEMRRATPELRELLADWADAFTVEALNEHDPEGAARAVDNQLALDSGEVRGLYVWWVGDVPVCMTSAAGPTPNGMRVNLVYTPPEHRRRGYAGALVAAVSQRVLDSGRRFCFLYTDLRNSTSNRVYQNVGYEPIADVDEYRFDEGETR